MGMRVKHISLALTLQGRKRLRPFSSSTACGGRKGPKLRQRFGIDEGLFPQDADPHLSHRKRWAPFLLPQAGEDVKPHPPAIAAISSLAEVSPETPHNADHLFISVTNNHTTRHRNNSSAHSRNSPRQKMRAVDGQFFQRAGIHVEGK